MSDQPLPLLQVRPSALASRALLVGDPARAAEAASRLDRAEPVGANREYSIWTGALDGRPVTVASHGIGAAGAAICFEELARGGVETMIRAGTCGAIDDRLGDGELVIATAAVRDEGVSARLVPETFPAAADPAVVAALGSVAAEQGVAVRSGVVLTSDLFYPGPLGPIDWDLWRRSGVLAIEMEMATLMVIGAIRGVRVGGVLTVDGNPTAAPQDMSEYDPFRESVREGTGRMIDLALAALVRSAG